MLVGNDTGQALSGDSMEAVILCCSCGTPISPNPAAMCLDCIRLTVDITEGIPREAVINHCRGCHRYLQPPSRWMNAKLESRELLTLCLDKLRGLNADGRRLIDAGFVWTEPNSKRLIVRTTLQKEQYTDMVLQQTLDTEFVVHWGQCGDCARTYTTHTWKALVQVRQKVTHKQTLLYLEQLLLRHRAHKEASNIKEKHQGLDFHYQSRHAAAKMVEFLQSVLPIRLKKSEELVSADVHAGTQNYKFTFSVELVPICKDDLVCLPPKLAKSLGATAPIMLCSRIASSLTLIDPTTCETKELPAQVYWRTPFPTVLDSRQLQEFTVLDVELTGKTHKNFAQADITIIKSNMSDAPPVILSHLGRLLEPGDTVLGYDLTTSNYNSALLDDLPKELVPDVVLVRKAVGRSRTRARNWKLQTLDKDTGELKPRKAEQDRIEADYDYFLQSLEEDPEMRSTVNLYKAKDSRKKRTAVKAAAAPDQMEEDASTVADDASEGGVRLDELLDEFEDMTIDPALSEDEQDGNDFED